MIAFVLALALVLCITIDIKTSTTAHAALALVVLLCITAIITQDPKQIAGVFIVAFLITRGDTGKPDLAKQIIWGLLIWVPVLVLIRSNAIRLKNA